MDFAKGPQPLPSIVHTLVDKIFDGDTDAIGLIANSRAELVNAGGDSAGRPPTAMLATFYRYTYSTLEVLQEKGEWWHRERVEGAPSRMLRAPADGSRPVPRKSPEGSDCTSQ
jgi:hypothetical protein